MLPTLSLAAAKQGRIHWSAQSPTALVRASASWGGWLCSSRPTPGEGQSPLNILEVGEMGAPLLRQNP